MTRQLVVLGLFALGLGLVLPPAGAEELAPMGGRFGIDIPGKATETSRVIKTPAGDIEIKLFLFQAKDNVYLVTYNDYPAEAIKGQSNDKRLDGAQKGALDTSKGTLVGTAKKIDLGGNPGREILIEAPDDMGFIRMRMYVVKDRLYQVVVTSGKDGKEMLLGAEADKFFNSFKLTAN